jgi:uroporphyrinogen-III synthase
MRLIVTRPIEDAKVLKAKLERLGHSVILSPLLDIVPLADAAIPEDRYQLIALTSANAARALARHPALPQLTRLSAFVVGPQSAQAAHEAGFADVHAEGGDAAGLADHIARTRDPDGGPVLYVSGRDSAGDFAGRLRRSGFSVTRVIAYEARPAPKLAPQVHLGADGVLLYSPRSARIWAELVAHEGLGVIVREMIHVCISGNAAAALPQAYAKRIAAQPTDAAVIAEIQKPET